MRLERALAKSGASSRRKAGELILQGRVAVNGKPVTDLWARIDPDKDTVTLDGAVVPISSPYTYIALHKPRGYVSTTHDPGGRPTVIDLIRGDLKERLYPAGRLDFHSEGLVILTNDGKMTNTIMHPSFQVRKRYRVWVKGVPSKADLDACVSGLMIEGGLTRFDEAKMALSSKGSSMIEVMLHEGKKREIRRVFDKLGYPVIRLQRLSIGPVELGSLPLGAWRPLSKREIEGLKQALKGREPR